MARPIMIRITRTPDLAVSFRLILPVLPAYPESTVRKICFP